jgi:uncharacterized protein (TIGR04255 family)
MTENASPLPSIPERRYNNPPVVEAFCEVYFTGSRWDPTIPGLFYEKVRKDFPQKSLMEQIGIEAQIGFGQAGFRRVPVESRMRFAREDNSQLVQLARDLLVVNQLPPYPHYELWRAVVLSTIDVYRQLACPEGIAQLGMRYINRINVLSPGIQMEHYFRVYPELPEELGPAHGPFMLQLVMSPVCPGHQLTLTLGSSPPEQPGSLSCLLDLYDVVVVGGRSAFEEVQCLLDEAHVNLVHTFENTIADASRKLFEEITDG